MFVTKRLHFLCRLSRCMSRKMLLTNSPCISNKQISTLLFQANSFSSHNLKGSTNSDTENETAECADDKCNDPHSLTKGDAELEHKLKVIKMEIEILKQEGKPVPPDEFITNEMWENLLNLPSRSGRMKYLTFLFKVSKAQENRLIKKLEKRKVYEEVVANRTPSHSISIEDHPFEYSLSKNSIFFRIKDTTMNHLYNSKLVQAMQFGQKLVLDCGYDQHMTSRENTNAAKQLMLLFAENRVHIDPFDVHFTNINKGSHLVKTLHKFIPTMYDRDFPMNITEESYLNLFPKDKLIYLTPHCREEMTTFDKDAIYIIGALVDKVNREPLSLAKAKRENLKMMKLPLDRYLQWTGGSGKSLTINQCIAILLDIKRTGDWNYALRHVPRRKLVDQFTGGSKSEKTVPKWQVPRKERSWKPGQKSRMLNTKSLYDED